MKLNRYVTIGIGCAAMTLLAGCETFWGGGFGSGFQQKQSTNLYDFLYSREKSHVDTPTNAVLSIPLRVGVAFVPQTQRRGNQGYIENSGISEQEKVELMRQVSSQFKKYPFVKNIEIIPTEYLMPQGGFENLDQLRSIYGVDVITLLSYDQVQFTSEDQLSLLYITVVGTLFIPGEKNDTRTMMDAAVYDIASRKLLFRAPGTSVIHARVTPVNQEEYLRAESQEGYSMAATNLVANLQVQLVDFKERVTNSPAEYRLVYKPGYTGSGAFGGMEALIVSALGTGFVWTRRNRKS
jgi:rhombotail lipoprotein